MNKPLNQKARDWAEFCNLLKSIGDDLIKSGEPYRDECELAHDIVNQIEPTMNIGGAS